MPRPNEAFGENDQTGRENAEADPRRSVTQAVAGTYEQDERQIAKPSESYERSDHQQPPVLGLSIPSRRDLPED